MMQSTNMIRHHLPLITSCVVFTSQALSSTPPITPCTDFNMGDLTKSGCGQETEETSGDSILSSLSSDEDEDEISPIPKPVGQVGRPCSGGYNLREVLGWTKVEFDKIQVT
jgi:hypothetical protein